MSKMKSRLLKIVPIILLVVLVLVDTVNAVSVDQLRNKTYSANWFSDDIPSYVGQRVSGGAEFDYPGAYCIDEHQRRVRSAYGFVDSVIDVNNDQAGGANKVIVYSRNGRHEYDVSEATSNRGVWQALRLAALAKMATQRGETHVDIYERNSGVSGSAKLSMSAMFHNTQIVRDLQRINVGRTMSPTGNMDGEINWSSTPGMRRMQEDLRKAGEEADSIACAITNKTVDEDAITIETINGKTYIGPYRVAYANCTLKEVKITTDSGEIITNKVSYDKQNDIDVVTLENERDFYVVAENEITETIKKVEIFSNTVKRSRTRIIVVDGGPSQNFIIYRGEEYEDSASAELPVPKFGKIKIIKVDQFKDSNLKLEGIEFKLYNEAKGWVSEKDNKLNFAKHFDDAKSYVTDAEGKISIDNLPLGTYRVYETKIPEGLKPYYTIGNTEVPIFGEKQGEIKQAKLIQYVKSEKDIESLWQLTSGKTLEATVVNDRAYTDLVLEKVDKDTGIKLNGIGFKIYRMDEGNTGWIQTDENSVVKEDLTDFEHATEYISGVTAKFRNLPVGKYAIYETSLGEYESLYDLGEFTLDGKTYPGHLVSVQEIKADETGTYTLKLSNIQTKISISGFVWEEQLTGKNTQERNSTYDEGVDRKIEGIEVRLINPSGEVERTTYTDAEGKYTFKDVRIRKGDEDERISLSDYRIQFVYDGVTYQDVISSYDQVVEYEDASKNEINKTSSKAVEDQAVREALNNDFKELTGNGQVLPSGIKLDYNKTEEGVTLNNTAKRTVISDTHVKVDGTGDFPVVANTQDVLLQKYLSNFQSKEKMVTEITNINLGLYIREMPNLVLQKDTYQADVSVNGYTYTYKYNQKLANNNTQTTLGVDFDGDYSLPIYKADAKYNPEDAGKGLEAKVMYKIKLQNTSTNLAATINGLKETYSEEYEIAKNNDGKLEIYLSDNNTETTFDENNRVEIGNYSRAIDTSDYITRLYSNGNSSSNVTGTELRFANPIKLGKATSEANTKYLYIKLKIKDIKGLYELATQEGTEPSTLKNIVEISNYSTYEDDNYTKLYAGVDSTSIPNTMNPEQYDETKEDDTDKAPGLKIVDAGERSLSGSVFEDNAISEGAGQERKGNGIFDDGETKISGVKVQLVDENGNPAMVFNGTEFVQSEAVETENGDFTLKGFIPGKYKVVYTWGDDHYNVIDYKGTIYVNRERANNLYWIKDEEPRYSDAMDDYQLRIAIDQKALYNQDTEGYSQLDKMNSKTPDFIIGVEKADYDEVLVGDRTKYEYNIHNVDFGIIERPRQSLRVTKDLTSIDVTTTQGQPIADAKIEDGKLNVITGGNYVSGGPDLGYIWLQLDKNINQGMTAKMGYKVTVTNDSELDYDDENYYQYGEINSNAKSMTLQAKDVYDYAKGSSLSSNTSAWETVAPGDYKIDTTLVESNFTKQINNASGEEVQNIRWNAISNKMQDIYVGWAEDMAQASSNDVRKVKVANREIIKYVGDELTKQMNPGESKTVDIETSKIIANGDEIRFDNDVEITDITYNTDQKTGRKPSATSATVYDRSDWVSITPATGDNKDYTWIVITGVSAIAILGAGIIIIKKKVLNNK